MAAQRLFHLIGKGVGRANWQIGIHLDRDVAVNSMSNPACAHVAHGPDAGYVGRRVFDLSKNLWLDAVDEASPNGNCSIFYDQEDGERDSDSDDRVKNRHAQGDTDDTDEHRQAGESTTRAAIATHQRFCTGCG
jgi:hypothetical protein